jgi:hypothetical protein
MAIIIIMIILLIAHANANHKKVCDHGMAWQGVDWYKTFFLVPYEWDRQARVFVPAKTF